MDALVGRDRASAVRAGVRIEMITVAWMAVEAALAIGAGVLARSVLLTAFGLDSVIELISGAVLLWRLTIEAHEGETERVERIEIKATGLSAVLLILLCLYVAASSVLGLVLGVKPAGSVVGIAVSGAAIVIMPLLVWAKRSVNRRIDSSALTADIAETLTCAYLAGATLAGVLLNTLFHIWWAEYLAAFVLLFWLVRETREALEATIKSP
jgi:divalent metal cation (Fe/Co/Zn/Cd) transporter